MKVKLTRGEAVVLQEAVQVGTGMERSLDGGKYDLEIDYTLQMAYVHGGKFTREIPFANLRFIQRHPTTAKAKKTDA